jgi:hypothetical protein
MSSFFIISFSAKFFNFGLVVSSPKAKQIE